MAIQKAMADRISAALETKQDAADIIYDLRGEFFMAIGLIEAVRNQLQKWGDENGAKNNKAVILQMIQRC